MPKGQQVYIPQRKRPIFDKVGLTTFGKDKATTSKKAPSPATKAGFSGKEQGYNVKKKKEPKPVTERAKYIEEQLRKAGG